MKKKNWIPWVLLALAPLVLGGALLIGPTAVEWLDPRTELGQALLLLRLNRVLAGFAVGAALAGAGVVLQALLRNPLAEPYVLGVSSGAALGAALAIFFGWTAWGALVLPVSAFALGLATMALVYALGSHQGSPSLYGLLLSGVIVSAVGSSLLLLLLSLSSVEGLHSITWWMLGNLQAASDPLLAGCGALIVFAGGIVWLFARELDALTLGREMAHHLGARPGLVVGLGLVCATLMTAAAVALAGLIGFVGLIVPHVVRSLIGPDHRRLLPAAALAGGLLLVLCDALARTVAAPGELPVGVVTALLGGPFFIVGLRRRRKAGWVE
ncbi:MAG: iron ABC transporter permease [Kiritimatiellaeota bacterium]|nr:iron ABC transporter permease [Kiritimatiellota bacterium]